MSNTREDLPLDAGASNDRLHSWKDIAAYLKRDVTTVQRWEKREGMPVHRHVHDKLGSVYAFRSELDSWMRTRKVRIAQDPIPEQPVDEPPAEVLQATEPALEERTTSVENGIPPERRPPRGFWVLVAVLLVAGGSAIWVYLTRAEFLWRDPIAGATFEPVTEFEGVANSAAISRDGQLVAFISDRDGVMDVLLTQIGTGRFTNLTHGELSSIVNPQVRTIGFTPDGAFVTFWRRDPGGRISVWAVPTLGGAPQVYLEGAAEVDWSRDGSRLVYHTPEPGDPMFLRSTGEPAAGAAVFRAAAGFHAHFPVWAPDGRFIYFVQGPVPEPTDVWRIRPDDGHPERITHHDGQVSHPVFLDARTLLYLATDRDGSGPWLYSVDVDHRVPHRLGTGLARYTCLAASIDGRRIAATVATPKRTLWRLPVSDAPADLSAPQPIPLATNPGGSPRAGPGYLLYVSSTARGDAIWKLTDGAATEIWTTPRARIIGGPEIAPTGDRVAFVAEQDGRTTLFVMNADGQSVRSVTGSLQLRGAPAWTMDGASITCAANVEGTPRLFRIALDGTATVFLHDYSLDPVWSPQGEVVVYSGPDIGPTFAVKAATKGGASYQLPAVTLSRGSRRVRFFAGRRALVLMRGDLQHKDLWLVDLEAGTERQLTKLPPDFDMRDFDVSSDGREILLERVQERSDIVLIDLGRR